jgi:dUTP pyrophosphatase
MKLKIYTYSDEFLPVNATGLSAALDVKARLIVQKDERTIAVHLGIKTQIPYLWQGKLYARSNISKSPFVLANGIGIIDSDYRGEWVAMFKYIDEVEISYPAKALDLFPYKVGDRVAQIQFEPVHSIQFLSVEEVKLEDTERGSGGFGSTGNSLL